MPGVFATHTQPVPRSQPITTDLAYGNCLLQFDKYFYQLGVEKLRIEVLTLIFRVVKIIHVNCTQAKIKQALIDLLSDKAWF